MRTTRSAIAGIMATVVLVAALAVPALAVAAPTSGATVRTAAVSTTPGRGMIARYRALANAHRIIFRAQVRTLSRRLDRLSFIATLAARAGGDVTGIRASIASARGHLGAARSLEATAYSELRRVPWAPNRAAALAQARADWKLTNAAVASARTDKQAAAKALKTFIGTLHLTSKVKASDFL